MWFTFQNIEVQTYFGTIYNMSSKVYLWCLTVMRNLLMLKDGLIVRIYSPILVGLELWSLVYSKLIRKKKCGELKTITSFLPSMPLKDGDYSLPLESRMILWPILTNRMWQKWLYFWGWDPRVLRLSLSLPGLYPFGSQDPCEQCDDPETSMLQGSPSQPCGTRRPRGARCVSGAFWNFQPSWTTYSMPLSTWSANAAQSRKTTLLIPVWIPDPYNYEQVKIAIFKPLCFGIVCYTATDNQNNWLTPPTIFPQGKFT